MIFLIGFLTVVLILICAFVTLVILMQRPSANAGMGSALGGGAQEQVFGADTGNVLTKWTIYGTAAFFILAFGLYLMHMSRIDASDQPQGAGISAIGADEQAEEEKDSEQENTINVDSTDPEAADKVQQGLMEKLKEATDKAQQDKEAAGEATTNEQPAESDTDIDQLMQDIEVEGTDEETAREIKRGIAEEIRKVQQRDDQQQENESTGTTPETPETSGTAAE